MHVHTHTCLQCGDIIIAGLNYLVWRCNVWVGGSPVRQKTAHQHQLIRILQMFLTLDSCTSARSIKPFSLTISKPMLNTLFFPFSAFINVLFTFSNFTYPFRLSPQQPFIHYYYSFMSSHCFKNVCVCPPITWAPVYPPSLTFGFFDLLCVLFIWFGCLENEIL